MSGPNGQLFAIKLRLLDGAELILAFPLDVLPGLVEMAALGQAVMAKQQGVPDNVRTPHTVSWFDLRVAEGGTPFLLSLTFGAGGRIDFALPGIMPNTMSEVLLTMLGQSTPPPPKASLN